MKLVSRSRNFQVLIALATTALSVSSHCFGQTKPKAAASVKATKQAIPLVPYKCMLDDPKLLHYDSQIFMAPEQDKAKLSETYRSLIWMKYGVTDLNNDHGCEPHPGETLEKVQANLDWALRYEKNTLAQGTPC